MMVPIDEALGELSDLAAQLNQQTEVLNSLILDLERRLAAAKVGVSIWLPVAEDENPSGVSFYYGLLAETNHGTKREGWQLGYGKLGDAWRILTKPVKQYFERPTEDPTEGYWVTDETGETVALANAPRQVRVDAAAHFERLVTELSEKVRKFLGNIEEAKNFVHPIPF